MKISGSPLVIKSMNLMKTGEKGFLNYNAIILFDEDLFIDTTMEVCKERFKEMIIPIKRTGENKEEFEIDLNIAIHFSSYAPSKEDRKEAINNDNIVGPYKITSTIYLNEILLSRLSLDELVIEFKTIKMDSLDTDNEIHPIRKAIAEKIKKLPVDEIKKHETTFDHFDDLEDMGMISINEDQELSSLIKQRLAPKEQKQLTEMSLTELEEARRKAEAAEDFETLIKIQQIMINN